MTDHDDFDDKPYRPPALFTDSRVGMILSFLAFCVLSAISCFVLWMVPPDSRVDFIAGGATLIGFRIFLLFIKNV